jgi:hypothetical protein
VDARESIANHSQEGELKKPVIRHWDLVIGHFAVIGIWSLVISPSLGFGHWSFDCILSLVISPRLVAWTMSTPRDTL